MKRFTELQRGKCTDTIEGSMDTCVHGLLTSNAGLEYEKSLRIMIYDRGGWIYENNTLCRFAP